MWRSIAFFVSWILVQAVIPGFRSYAAQRFSETELIVKFTEEAASILNIREMSGKLYTGILEIDTLGAVFKLEKCISIFPGSGKFHFRRSQFGLQRYYKLTFASGVDIQKALEAFKHAASVEYAQLNRRYSLYARREKVNFIPNDPLFNNQWFLHNTGQTGGTPDADIDAPEAWDVQTGSPSVLVSVLDTGLDLDHPDLSANVWTNPGEIPGNGLDDDNNGYVDDVHGWDFSDGDNNPDDYDNHGTHTAGTIAAVTNNGIGVAGIAFDATVLPCKIFPDASDAVIAEAFVYAADNGAIVSSNSWGYSAPGPPSQIIEDAIDYFLVVSNGVVVFAAGNDNTNDPTWGYPASYPPVMAVAATDHNDIKASFSNWGDWVDVSAPGVDIWSTVIGGYDSFSGTSMACPQVAAIAALLFANGMTDGSAVRTQIESSAESIDSQNPGYEGLLGSGRVNANFALTSGPFPKPPTNLQATVSNDRVTLTWTDPIENTDGTPILLQQLNIYRNGQEIARVDSGAQTFMDISPPNGFHTYYVTAVNRQGEESIPSNPARVLIGSFDVLIWQPRDVTQPDLIEKARSRGITVDRVRAMLRPSQSARALQEALAEHNRTSVIVSDIVGLDLSQFHAVFAVMGIFPNNHVIQENSEEALLLENYILGGGKVYMEGGDVWFWDPINANGHNFNSLFGIDPIEDGSSDLNQIQGADGTFTEGLDYFYSGQNNYIDRISPVSPAITIHQNDAPPYDCGVANDAGSYKTIGTSFEFAGLVDGTVTKSDLMAAYLDFLDLPPVQPDAIIWLPQDVLHPNLSQKAQERGLTLQQVKSLQVEINSHVALQQALEANGKVVRIVNDLTAVDLSTVDYLFIVLGIYPNNHVVKSTDPEAIIIENFLADSGKVYIEGGDVWYFDPLKLGGYNFAPAFGINPEEDGYRDLKTVLGQSIALDMDFVYKGENYFIDRISPLPGAFMIHSNYVPLYGTGVGFDDGSGKRTIGLSMQFGGLTDSSLSFYTKVQLMEKYLQFFDEGAHECQITIISPNGGEKIIAGSQFDIVWTSLLTGGSVTIELSTDGGNTYSTIVSGTPDDGLYTWDVPELFAQNCIIKISDAADPNCFDLSDSLFGIISKPWLVPVTVNAVGTQTSSINKPTVSTYNLSFGGHAEATDGFDFGLDTPAPPPGFTYSAYFLINELPYFLHQDIKSWVSPFDTPLTWVLQVVNATGITTELSWEPDSLPGQGLFTLLEIVSGTQVNMRMQSSIQFSGDAQILIECRPEQCFDFEFPLQNGGWYLVSLPVIPEDSSVAVLFPDAIAAFGWDFDSQSYRAVTTLSPGNGYWLFFLSPSSAEICGMPFNSFSRTYQNQGWDLIGAPALSGTVEDDPDGSVVAMFGWEPQTQSYVALDTMVADPQNAYWIMIFTAPSTVTVGGTAGAQQAYPNLSKPSRSNILPPSPPQVLQTKEMKSIPGQYALLQNYPNPFNPQTTIEFHIPEPGHVLLTIYTVLGQKVRTLVDGYRSAGIYRITWDGRNQSGETVGPGIYLYEIKSGDFTKTKKLVFVK